MLGHLFHARGQTPRGAQTPPETLEGVPVETLAGARSVGLEAGVGQVAPGAQLGRVDQGGRLELLGHRALGTGLTLEQPRIPDSAFVDRALYGGIRSAPHVQQFREDPAFTGGYSVVTGRVQVQLGSITVEVLAPTEVVRLPIGPSACDTRAAAVAGRADDLAAVARSGARQSLGMLS